MRPSNRLVPVLALVLLPLFGCGPASSTSDDGGSDVKTPPAIEVAGNWDDDYAGPTAITSTRWGPSAVISYDNDAREAILQSPPDDQYTPNEFSKFVWTKPDATGFWYCIVEYGQATADAAKASTKTADASDPANGGCGGFSWTRMRPHFVLDGTWDDDYGDTTTISATMWGTSKVVSYDDDAQFAILQSPEDDQYTPNEFAKYVWTTPDATGWWYCIVDYGQATAEDAASTTNVADASDPANGGCGTFPWSHMKAHAE